MELPADFISRFSRCRKGICAATATVDSTEDAAPASESFAPSAASARTITQVRPQAVDWLDMGGNSNDISLVIIDDNAGSLELLSAALENEGIRIFTAQDPEEGVEIVFREHPQIVLTDLVMPGLSGLDVLDRVVAFDPVIDVVLMTAHYTS